MHRTNPSLDQAEFIQKDAIISALKKQLYDLQDQEHQHNSLTDEITNVESKQAILLDEKERIENQHKIKLDINRKTVNELRAEVDKFKIQIHKCSVNIDDIIRESQTMRRMCENRENQIASLMVGNQDLDAKNQQLLQDNKANINKIKSLKDERNKNDNQCERLQRLLQENVLDLKRLQKQARALDSSNHKLENILSLAQKDYSELIEDLKNRQSIVNQTHGKLQQLNKDADDLRDKTSKLEKECLKNQQEFRNICQILEATVNKNKELTKRLKQLQNNLRDSQNQLDRAILQRDGLQNDHHSLSNQHKILNHQIDKILVQIMEYQRINSQLQKEVQHYIECDEEARNMLNRRDVMRSMLEQVTNKLGKTGETIAHLR